MNEENTVRQLQFKDGDGGGGMDGISLFQVAVVENGYIVTVIDDEGDEFTYVEHSLEDVISLLREFEL
jgi:hypothetical protein